MQRTILIIEDENLMLEALTDKFEKEGFNVLQAKDGQKGLEMALDEKPDAILLDIILPKKGGLKMLGELRESGEWGSNVPVIILTNLGTDDATLVEVVKESPSYYLIKSDVKLKEVVEKVREVLS